VVKKSGRNKQDIDPEKWKENLRILYDFVIKVKALKVCHCNVRCVKYFLTHWPWLRNLFLFDIDQFRV